MGAPFWLRFGGRFADEGRNAGLFPPPLFPSPDRPRAFVARHSGDCMETRGVSIVFAFASFSLSRNTKPHLSHLLAYQASTPALECIPLAPILENAAASVHGAASALRKAAREGEYGQSFLSKSTLPCPIGACIVSYLRSSH